MSKKNSNSPPRKCTKESQKKAIRRSYAIRAAKERAGRQAAQSSGANNLSDQAAPRQTSVGKIYRGNTKYIDKEPKRQRDYVVVRDVPSGVTVAKVKSIKKFDENGKNADRALVEINHERYGYPNRTGVDFERLDKNRMSGKPLDLKDKDVFPEDKERATLSRRDRDNVLYHTGVKKRNKPKK